MTENSFIEIGFNGQRITLEELLQIAIQATGPKKSPKSERTCGGCCIDAQEAEASN